MLDSMCLCNRKMNTRLRLFLGLLVYIYIVLETALVVVLKHFQERLSDGLGGLVPCYGLGPYYDVSQHHAK